MKVQILMSTYNGEPYLRTQLDSIINQSVEEKYLLIRDDGSIDKTIEIIQEYQQEYPWISYYKGTNIGVRRSFMELIAKADLEMDYIAFADQDDLWLPEKLNRAVECLEKMNDNMPLLYCSDKIIVGENLEEIHATVSRTVKKITFGNALVQNICTGCTAVINQAMLHLLRSHMPRNPNEMIMHDWWLYLTATCFGEVFYDVNSYIKYRQHGNNAVGAIVSQKNLFKYRILQLTQSRGDIYRQIELFAKSFKKELCTSHETEGMLIQKLLSAKEKTMSRIGIIFDRRYFRQKYFDDFVFRSILLINKL